MQVRTYSEWVIDGDYDWPPKCPVCQENLEDSQKETVRLGCLRELTTKYLLTVLGRKGTDNELSL
jgi:hypothetical protein